MTNNTIIKFGRFSYEIYPHGLIKVIDTKAKDTYYLQVEELEQAIIETIKRKREAENELYS